MNRTTLPRPSTHLSRALSRALSGAAAALLLGSALTACGDEASSSSAGDRPSSASTSASTGANPVLEVEDPWVRATTGTEDPTMSAAFMTLDNTGDVALRVVGASSEVAGTVQLHEMAEVDGKAAMRQIADGIALEPGRGQLLQPGGMHVMLMDLTTELAPGDEVELTLELDDGTQVEVTAPVKAFTEEEGHYHAPGTDENHSH
ncbi:copper chaperone PCu(A)C [Nocardioides houyundeii]|uniref:copper chaperone PCu(A)C n=1 Tax=Nocardioides houyundeii TaxID=2045452 RepID=UPI000C75F9ED|nr:copper chaperone PCu(A)C [Nocardioides houyundeii]